MSGICLVAGLLVTPLGDDVTLAWTHSIEKIRWEEDYRREGNTLRVVAARIRGTGAGMEPPAGAQLKEGVWHFKPNLPPLPRVELQHSPHVAPYDICISDDCRSIEQRLPGLPANAVIEMTPCAEDR